MEEVRSLILSKGASVHATGMVSSRLQIHGHSLVASSIIRISIHSILQDNWTALHFASRKGHKMVVDLLLCLGANVNALTRVRYVIGWTLIFCGNAVDRFSVLTE